MKKIQFRRFEELIKKSKELFGIDAKSGKVIFNISDFTNPEKISLLLTGKYFYRELGLLENDQMDINQISSELGIIKTSLSAPLDN